MNWVLCYLNPNDYVSFRTNLSDSNEYIYYSKFLEFILPYIKKDSEEFLEYFNKYYTIYIDLEQGKWEIYKKEYRQATFDELLSLNEKREQQKKNEKETKQFGAINLYKNNINNFFKKSYENKFFRNRPRTRESIPTFFNKFKRRVDN